MFVSPMLLQKTDAPIDSSEKVSDKSTEWLTELKMDGFRLLLTKFNNKIKLYTRHSNEVTTIFPELTNLDIANGTILDGEVIAPDKDSKPDFEAVMRRFRSNKSKIPIQFVVFDILYFKGEKITHLPLLERKELLSKVVPKDNPNIVEIQWMTGNGTAFFELVKKHDLEGLVFKNSKSIYEVNKRSYNWLKLINYKYEKVVISGIRKDEFGVLLSSKEGKTLGVMEFMIPSERSKLYKMSRELKQNENEKYIYFKPQIECLVKYRNYTSEGKLRIPSFVEWTS